MNKSINGLLRWYKSLRIWQGFLLSLALGYVLLKVLLGLNILPFGIALVIPCLLIFAMSWLWGRLQEGTL